MLTDRKCGRENEEDTERNRWEDSNETLPLPEESNGLFATFLNLRATRLWSLESFRFRTTSRVLSQTTRWGRNFSRGIVSQNSLWVIRMRREGTRGRGEGGESPERPGGVRNSCRNKF